MRQHVWQGRNNNNAETTHHRSAQGEHSAKWREPLCVEADSGAHAASNNNAAAAHQTQPSLAINTHNTHSGCQVGPAGTCCCTLLLLLIRCQAGKALKQARQAHRLAVCVAEQETSSSTTTQPTKPVGTQTCRNLAPTFNGQPQPCCCCCKPPSSCGRPHLSTPHILHYKH